MKKGFRSWFKALGKRYRDIPRQIHSPSVKERSKAQKLITVTVCVLLMLACGLYMLHWQLTKTQVEQDNASYSSLYHTASPTPSATPSASPTVRPTPSPTGTPPSSIAPKASDAPAGPAASLSAEATPAPTEVTATASVSPAAPAQSAAPSPQPSFEVVVDATYVPAPTPDADTLVYSIETPPPVQESFAELLKMNPETIGFLTIDDLISLPVVQRQNDNSYYLNHSFEGEMSAAGTLFLDGSNLLVPEDKNLIIYGHNMRNGTMFQPLIGYEDTDFLRKHPLVRFDTIYENRSYVPFAAFTATMDYGSEHYLDVRQFIFDEATFDLYIKQIRRLSLYESPVEVEYGDNVLMLVTCEYLHDNGRFIVALRELRPDETEADMRRLVRQTKLR